MKTSILRTSLLFSALTSAVGIHTASATELLTPTPFPLEGKQLTPIFSGQSDYFMVTSETAGLTITDDNAVVLARHAGHFSQSDVIIENDHSLIIAALNNDSYDIDMLRYDTTSRTFSPLPSIHADLADVEAVCISLDNERVVATTADALGRFQQFALVGEQFIPLRTVNVGAGIKSCQTSPVLNQILFADEHVGVWNYAFAMEADDQRHLLAPARNIGVEGVALDRRGTLYAVSPEINGLLYLNDGQWQTLALPQHYQFESVRVSLTGNNVVAGLYDDNSESLMTLTFPAPVVTHPAADQQHTDGRLQAFAQTDPVARVGDAADDPAIWYISEQPELSVILGTDKKAGLDLFDLTGKRLQHLPVGRLNNVDVRNHWQTNTGNIAVAAATNRTTGTIDIFTLDGKTRLATPAAKLATTLDDVYGLCLFQHGNQLHVIANDTSGHFERHQLSSHQGIITSEITEHFSTPGQPEGCVADDATGMLYYGEEDKGIWRRNLLSDKPQPAMIAKVGGKIKDDIEGMALFDVDDERYLIVSSQGNHSYGVYTTSANPALIGTFTISANFSDGIDGVSETDGLEAISLPLTDALPEGLLVVQDGHNVMPSQQQNFKLVAGTALADFIRQHRH